MKNVRHINSEKLTNQLLDYHLIPELINHYLDKKNSDLKSENYIFNFKQKKTLKYIEKVRRRMLDYGIEISNKSIRNHSRKILSGNAVLSPLTEFNGIPGKREGKDLNYAGFWTMVDIFIPDKENRAYIGLAANQIDTVRNNVKGWITVCERDKNKAKELNKLNSLIMETKGIIPYSHVENVDIFEYLNNFNLKAETNLYYNIFDLDLMKSLPEENILDYWINLINKSTKTKQNIIINLTATIGRSITKKEHNKRAKYFRSALVRKGFCELGYTQFAYRDRVIPMQAERIALSKT